jgi:hypothetical protein
MAPFVLQCKHLDRYFCKSEPQHVCPVSSKCIRPARGSVMNWLARRFFPFRPNAHVPFVYKLLLNQLENFFSGLDEQANNHAYDFFNYLSMFALSTVTLLHIRRYTIFQYTFREKFPSRITGNSKLVFKNTLLFTSATK